MFTITAKGIYGLTALLDLCDSYLHGPRQIKDIAQQYNIPQHYLEQILVALKKGGIVESFRGAQGGYALAKSPTAIKVIEALSQLEGKLELLPDQRKDTPLAFFWQDLENHIKSKLEKSLAELLAEFKLKQSQLFYDI
jgi:Rrf2 family cysteine metabolism transcriptional repressor